MPENKQQINELTALRNRIDVLEKSEKQWRQTEKMLKENDRRTRALLDNSAEGIWHIDMDGYTVYINRAMCAALEIEAPEELAGITFHRFFTPESLRTMTLEHAKRTSGVGSSYEVEIIGKLGGRRNIIISGTPIFSDRDELQGLIGFFIDITERKRTEEAFRKISNKFEALIKASPVAICLLDVDGNVTLWSPAAEKIFGWKKEEVLSHPNPVVPVEKSEEFKQNLKHVLAGKSISNLEVTRKRKDNSLIHISLSVAPLLGEDGKIIGVAGLMVDITQRKRAEEEKARIEEQYHQAQKVESIGRLAGGVAHDLNNLLSPIIGYSEMLFDDLPPDNAHKKNVEQIIQAGLRARDLVHQLLAFSRKQPLEYKPVNINTAVTGFEKLMRRTIREDIDIRLDLTSVTLIIMADIGQIEQVIMNLAINAADAMPEGGLLTIETALTELDENYAASHPDVEPGKYVMLAVSDTGCSMDAETRQNIFEPFFSTKGEQGTGLGLSTVYGIIKQHGGNIWIYSEPDKGTIFKIYLPILDTPPVEEKVSQKTVSDVKSTETILLVEDNKLVRDLSHTILKRQGYRVLQAENAAEALACLDAYEAPVHLLLTDVIMPGMTGKELYAKAAEKQSGLKVLYMSGYTDNVIAHQGVLEEGVQFISKPFTVHGLAAKVREVLAK